MEYGRLISESLRLAWRNKSLWFFGFFAGGIGVGLSIDPSFRDVLESLHMADDALGLYGTPAGMLETLVVLAIVVGVFAIAFLTMHLICTPALIDAVNKLVRGGVYQFGTSFSAGLDFFWRFFGLALIAIIIGIAGLAISIAIGLALPNVDSGTLALLGLFLLPVTLVVNFFLTAIYALTQRAIVIRNVGLADGLHEGLVLFRDNFLKSLVLFLIYIGLSIAVGIAVVVLLAIVAIPFIILGVIMGSAAPLLIVVALIFGVPLIAIAAGFIATVLQNLYTLFYIELVEPRTSPAKAPPAAATPLA